MLNQHGLYWEICALKALLQWLQKMTTLIKLVASELNNYQSMTVAQLIN